MIKDFDCADRELASRQGINLPGNVPRSLYNPDMFDLDNAQIVDPSAFQSLQDYPYDRGGAAVIPLWRILREESPEATPEGSTAEAEDLGKVFVSRCVVCGRTYTGRRSDGSNGWGYASDSSWIDNDFADVSTDEVSALVPVTDEFSSFPDADWFVNTGDYKHVRMCRPCFEAMKSELMKCADCGGWFPSKIMAESSNGRLCTECAPDHGFFACKVCGKMLDFDNRDYHRSFDEVLVCDDCWAEYEACDKCGNLFHKSQVDDYGLCTYCSGSRGLHKHLDTSDAEFISDDTGEIIKATRTVGIEFEVEDGTLVNSYKYIPNGCGITTDGSLSGTGSEIQSVVMQGKSAEAGIDKICEALRDRGGYGVSERCGLHVHIGLSDSEIDSMLGSLFIGLSKIEGIFYSLVASWRRPGTEWGNHYCKSLGAFMRSPSPDCDKHTFARFWTGNPGLSVGELAFIGDTRRYHGFNFAAVYKQKTLEQRMFGGSLDNRDIKHWIGLLVDVIDYICDCDDVTSLSGYPSCESVRESHIKDFASEYGLSDELLYWMLERRDNLL